MVDGLTTCDEREPKITKWNYFAQSGIEPGTFRFRGERAKRWAFRADKYRSPKGDRMTFHVTFKDFLQIFPSKK